MDTPTFPPSEPPAPPEPRRVEFLSPLEPAWARMRRMLFPFDIRTWCTVGFGCFLAKLAEGGFGGGGSGGNWNLDDSNAAPLSLDGAGNALGRWVEGFAHAAAGTLGLRIDDWHGPMIVSLLAALVLLVLALVVLLIYLSARGHFVFVDNVALERAAFWVPWREYRREGHSLFFWRLGFLGVSVVAFLVLLFVPLLAYFSMQDSLDSELGIGLLVGWILLVAVPLMLLTAYVDLWLTEFVVPLMFQHRLATTEAWRRFLPLLRGHVFDFLAWGLLVFGLHFLVGMAVLAAGFATCCIGLILVIIPYVGTVLLLPLHLTYRAYSLEFLAQYGDEWWRFPPPWIPEETAATAGSELPSESPEESPPTEPGPSTTPA